MQTETTTVHISTPVNYICYECGKPVDKNSPDTQWKITGHGKFRSKQYFHKSCVMGTAYGRRA